MVHKTKYKWVITSTPHWDRNTAMRLVKGHENAGRIAKTYKKNNFYGVKVRIRED
jgi:D-arabinose 1-dehydrogenase-like Zn-dependent alcohol dehydrogenase